MAAVHPLRVPAAHVPPLSKLAELEEPGFGGLMLALQREPPALVMSEVESAVVDADVGIMPELAADLLDALLAIGSVASGHEWTYAEAAQAVAMASELRFESEESRERFIGRLTAALGSPAVQILSKVLDVVSVNERLFHSARTVTELRPIWETDPSEPPTAALITHTLQISYFGEDGLSSFFVALSEEEVDTLISVLERARAKAGSLRQMATSAGLRVAGVEL